MSYLDLARFGENISRTFTVDFVVRSVANPDYVHIPLRATRTALDVDDVVGIKV